MTAKNPGESIQWLNFDGSNSIRNFLDLALTYKSLMICGSDSRKVEQFCIDLLPCLSRNVHVIVVSSDQVEVPQSSNSFVSQLKTEADRTVIQCLRSSLRMDPDVIINSNGELESLDLYINAALTGHGVAFGLTLESHSQALELTTVVMENSPVFPFLPEAIPFLLELDCDSPEVGIGAIYRLSYHEEDGLGTELLWNHSTPLDEAIFAEINPAHAKDMNAIEAFDTAQMADWPELSVPVQRLWESMIGSHAKTAFVPKLEALTDDCAAIDGYNLRPLLKPEESWPTTPVNQHPLRMFLQLQLKNAPAELRQRFTNESAVLQFFYYSGDDEPGDSWEAFSGYHLVRVIDGANAKQASEVPQFDSNESFEPYEISGFEEYRDFPNWEEREALIGDLEEIANGEFLELSIEYLSDREIKAIAAGTQQESYNTLLEYFGIDTANAEANAKEVFRFAGPYCGHKALGWPLWTQGIEYPTCPKSGKTMELIWQLSAENYEDLWFGQVNPTPSFFAADGTGHLFQSPEHPEILAFAWAC